LRLGEGWGGANRSESEAMFDARSELTVSLWRGAQQGRYETYNVPLRENQTVLDVVTFVQRHLDPTLSYRFACRVGVCGSCAMTVNGRPRWTCRTHVSSVAKAGRLEIGPLENLPVIKDLATDMRPFFEKWQQAKGALVPSKTRHDAIDQIRPDSPARVAADAAIECINCGICYAACDTVRWNADYLGPAALNRAWTLVNDARDAGNAARLAAVAADGGCHACHSHQSCQELCPQALNPTASIAGLKRRTAAAYLKGEIKA
jgi:fumarate reductase iron-sulfur subunit